MKQQEVRIGRAVLGFCHPGDFIGFSKELQ